MDNNEAEDGRAQAQSLTSLIVETPLTEDGRARAKSLTILSEDDRPELVEDQPLLSSRLVAIRTGQDQPKMKESPPIPDPNHPGQDGLTGQTGDPRPEGEQCSPHCSPPDEEVMLDKQCPTVKLAEEGGRYDTSTLGAYFVDNRARSQDDDQDEAQDREYEVGGVMSSPKLLLIR